MPTGADTKDPYTGLQPESVFAIWHDPTSYDLMKHGPPYLPASKEIKVGSDRKQIKDVVRPLVEKTSADALTTILIVAQHIRADLEELPMSHLAALVAFLRAESMMHQAHHWQAFGQNYYSDHLLFERLYNEVIEDIDKLAERMLGSGPTCLANPMYHAKHVSAVAQVLYAGAPSSPSPDENAMLSFRAVLYTLVLLKFTYAQLEERKLLSHGLDNLLQGIADKHEEHVYLLKRRVMSKNATSYDRRPVALGDQRWK
jgi:DNA-binding ferritin-like protein